MRVLLLLAFTGTAFAQITPGPDPVTGTLTSTQTLASGTGTVTSSGQIRIASGSTNALNMSGTSTLVNSGSILTLGSGRAIDSNSGIANLTVTNNGLISSVSSDAFRVNTNSNVSLFNTGTIRVTAGGQAIDWAAISTATNILNNQATGVISAVGEDAVRMGANGQLTNLGTISATPTVNGSGAVTGSDGIDLRTLSGIRVDNSGTISGRHGIATDGANAGPSSFSLTNRAGGVVAALNGSGVNIDGVSANVFARIVNFRGGSISGGVLAGALEGDGDGIDVDGLIDLANEGDIFGRGARGANNAEGVAAGGGLIYNNSSGRIVGSTLAADAPNGDGSRAGNGILIDDSNGGNAVASLQLENYGLIEGKSGFGIKIVGGFDDVINNATGGIIRGAGTEATIQTGGGNDSVVSRGAIISTSGRAIDLGAGDDRLQITGGAATVVGDISGGEGVNVLGLTPGNGNDLSYSGVLSNFDDVTVAGHVTLSGANQYTGSTTVDAGKLTLDGMNRLSSSTRLSLIDSTLSGRPILELTNTTGANGQTFAGLALDGAAIFDLGFSSLTFNSLTSLGAGSSLTVIDWSAATSPEYALRFLGDLGAGDMFLALMNGTTINGMSAAFSFDGTYTNVSAVPLPGALLLLVSGLGCLARRRKAGAL